MLNKLALYCNSEHVQVMILLFVVGFTLGYIL